jgi:hypothetical protein
MTEGLNCPIQGKLCTCVFMVKVKKAELGSPQNLWSMGECDNNEIGRNTSLLNDNIFEYNVLVKT